MEFATPKSQITHFMSEITMGAPKEPWEVRKARAIARTKGVKVALGIPRDKRFFQKLDEGQ